LKKRLGILFLSMVLIALAACGSDADENDNADTDLEELAALEVELDVSEEVDVDETVEMKAFVTYGDEEVTDADEVIFEVWEEGEKDESAMMDEDGNSEMIDATNHEDGTYTAETSFDHDGLYHVQVHVTAREMHTMPKKEVTVGEGGEYEEASTDADGVFQTDGLSMEFSELEEPKAGEEVDLVTLIEMEDETLADAQVRYEIWNYDISNKHDWVDAEETETGEYSGTHTFDEAGTYTVQIHVEDDDELHEHMEYEIEVK